MNWSFGVSRRRVSMVCKCVRPPPIATPLFAVILEKDITPRQSKDIIRACFLLTASISVFIVNITFYIKKIAPESRRLSIILVGVRGLHLRFEDYFHQLVVLHGVVQGEVADNVFDRSLAGSLNPQIKTFGWSLLNLDRYFASWPSGNLGILLVSFWEVGSHFVIVRKLCSRFPVLYPCIHVALHRTDGLLQ